MKRALVLALLAGLPIIAQATDVNVNIGSARIQSGNTTITFGDRDRRGYYWERRTSSNRTSPMAGLSRLSNPVKGLKLRSRSV